MGNTLKPSIKFLSTPRGNDIPPRGWNGGSSNREKQGRCSRRPGETGRGRGDIVAVVAVGREGVVCRGREVTEEGWLCLSFSSYGIPTERGPTSLLASRFSLAVLLVRATYDA